LSDAIVAGWQTIRGLRSRMTPRDDSRVMKIAIALLITCSLLVGRASARGRFPTDDDVARAAEKAERSQPDARAAIVLKLCRSMLHPSTTTNDRTLSRAARRLARLYRDTDDDRVLDAIIAAGFDTEAAETFHGGLASSLEMEAGPLFLRRHPKAARFVHGESGIGPALELAEYQCLKAEAERGHDEPHNQPPQRRAPQESGLLLANTAPRALIAIDGKNTGQTTPVDEHDRVWLGTGKHRVTFTVDGHETNIDVDVPNGRNACLYRELGR
jgi:hypothetical protein